MKKLIFILLLLSCEYTDNSCNTEGARRTLDNGQVCQECQDGEWKIIDNCNC
jgi:hypothetical protein